MDPVYRTFTSSMTAAEREEAIAKSNGKYTMHTTLGEFSKATSTIGTFLWTTVNFGSSKFTNQYSTNQPMNEMITTWYNSDVPDIVGSLCAGKGCVRLYQHADSLMKILCYYL